MLLDSGYPVKLLYHKKQYSWVLILGRFLVFSGTGQAYEIGINQPDGSRVRLQYPVNFFYELTD